MHLSVPQHQRVGDRQDDMVRLACKMRRCDRDLAVVGRGQDAAGEQRIERAIACDDANGIVDAAKPRLQFCRPVGAEKGGRVAQHQPVETQPAQKADPLASGVRRAKHHHAPERRGPADRGRRARDEAAHRMADDVDLPA